MYVMAILNQPSENVTSIQHLSNVAQKSVTFGQLRVDVGWTNLICSLGINLYLIKICSS